MPGKDMFKIPTISWNGFLVLVSFIHFLSLQSLGSSLSLAIFLFLSAPPKFVYCLILPYTKSSAIKNCLLIIEKNNSSVQFLLLIGADILIPCLCSLFVHDMKAHFKSGIRIFKQSVDLY